MIIIKEPALVMQSICWQSILKQVQSTSARGERGCEPSLLGLQAHLMLPKTRQYSLTVGYGLGMVKFEEFDQLYFMLQAVISRTRSTAVRIVHVSCHPPINDA